MYALAGLQRKYAADYLDYWPPPEPPRSIDAHLLTLACERDKVLLFRMASSFLSRVGRPSSFVVVSDGSLSARTIDALHRLSPSATVQNADELLASEWVPESVRRLARSHVLGIKIAMLMRPVDGLPHVLVDTDVAFLRGAPRFTRYLETLGERPRYMEHPELVRGIGQPRTYDPRLIAGKKVLPRVNSGLILWRAPLDWSDAVSRIEAIADDARPLSEQTAVALALTDSDAVVLPPDEFILSADDGGSPIDQYARKDVILRHYFSIGLQWKMNLKGGPHGALTVPYALGAGLRRRFTTRRTRAAIN